MNGFMEITTTDLSKMLNVTVQRVSAIAKAIKADELIETRGRNKFYSSEAVKKLLSHRGASYEVKKNIVFCNNKGGTGKTSTAINTALRLASMGFKTLLVDADSQSNSSAYFMPSFQNYDIDNSKVLYDVVTGACKIDETIIKISETLDVIPSALINDRINVELQANGGNPETYFKKLFSQLDYNYIIWDLSPSLSVLNHWILLAADNVVIVTNLDEFSLQGVEMTYEMVRRSMENFPNYKPDTRVLINRIDIRMKSALDFFSKLKTICPMYQSFIRVDNQVQRSQTAHSCIPHTTNAYDDISSFVTELIDLNVKLKTIQ